MSLLPMLDTVIDKMAEWFNRHRKDAAAGPPSQKLVTLVENKMHTVLLEKTGRLIWWICRIKRAVAGCLI